MPYFDEEVIKNYDQGSDKAHILDIDIEQPKKLHDLQSNLPFLPERILIIHLRMLKQALSHGLILWKVRRVIQFNQKAWLK